MGSVADLALSAIAQAQRRVEVAAQNLSNVTTPAYKRRVPFAALVAPDRPDALAMPQISTVVDFRGGKMQRTGKPADLALAGPGFFVLRSDDDVVYTRLGQFTVDADGRLVNARGFALQTVAGGDLVVTSSNFAIAPDGTVTEQGRVLGRVAVVASPEDAALEPVDGGFRSGAGALAPSDEAIMVQGSVEASNVSTGDEMVAMIEALRRAESGQRIMNVYDDLLGRVITTFGETGR